MKRGYLRDCFSGVGVKRLSAVDADPKRSNQHEVGTTAEMRTRFLGETHQKQFGVRYVFLGKVDRFLAVDGKATHYDARRGKPNRSPEWRLYYPANQVTVAMRECDTLFLAKDRKGLLWFIVAEEESTAERQLCWLFSVPSPTAGKKFITQDFSEGAPELDFAAKFILEELGFEPEESETDRLDTIIEPLGDKFPPTADFSMLARRTLPEASPRDDPDRTLLAWLDHEEALFRRLEHRVVANRLRKGFTEPNGVDVDGFISFSLSVQNRRKSRMGHSLEHHLAAVLDAWNISYDRQAMTENKHRPDFLFPSAEAYVNAVTGSPSLMMLGVKSSCKERWRQVLAEASKIPTKHLLTLEPGISEPQTSQMTASKLQLVVPHSIHSSYSQSQQSWLWSLVDFLLEVAKRQT